MSELKLLYVEDDKSNREDLEKILDGDKIGEYTISMESVDTFENAIDIIESKAYHIIILDLFKGNPQQGGKEEGLDILTKIQQNFFVPVIFYSGNTKHVQDLKSQIVGVVTKGDEGVEGLKTEIGRLVQSNLPFLKDRVHEYLESEFKTYFWDIIHNQRDKFKPEANDFSLGYLMLRKFSTSLSKEKISQVIKNGESKDKVHPMEFYLYPTDVKLEFESGEILQKGKDVYVILTPSCDFIEDLGTKRVRSVGKVLLAKTSLLSQNDSYIKYTTSKTESNKNRLMRLIESRKGDRFFFLPQTPFIENRIIDFQDKEMVDYGKLKDFYRIAKLDSPFAESMISSFIRYYNRIGYPDIDSDLIIRNL
ncbi:response regulator [Bacteroides sp. 519]|uniref:response regulator n=1 Tax=Bacteroides sp. 519 TaxID=2302937 RepID=UPI0013D76267|nr:response regulator [Bacteroides sp. 519]NDV58210.1 response regulator [Bacteroides sp. 519]